jgi:hypothetical protein
MDADPCLLTTFAEPPSASPVDFVQEPNVIPFPRLRRHGATTHSTSTQISVRAAALGAVVWVFNAVLLTIMGSGFALAVVAYSVAAWKLFHS